jgi:hypothetical protein
VWLGIPIALVLSFPLAHLLPAQESNSSNNDSVAHFGTVVFSSGFQGDIYYLHHWTSHLPNLEKMKPKGTIYTQTLNTPPQHFDAGFPGVGHRFEWFAINYSTRFWVAKAGTYRFSLLADDAADLYIDDALVIDNDGQHPPQKKEGSVQLDSGIHRMRVPYYQGPKYEVALVLMVQGPDDPALRVFNTNDFKPPVEPTGQ